MGVTDTGTILPGTATTASATGYANLDWTNPTNVMADDATYASITSTSFDGGTTSYLLKAAKFGLSVPASATVNGVEVAIDGYYATSDPQLTMCRLLDESGGTVGDNKAAGTVSFATTPGTIRTFGGTADNWGAALNPGTVNHDNFGVALGFRSSGNNAKIYLDYVTVKVTYTTAGGTAQYPAGVANGVSTAVASAQVLRYPAGQAAGSSGASASLAVDGWELQRSDGGSTNFADLRNFGTAATGWDDSGPFVDGTAYYYRVRQVTGGTAGAWSNLASLTYAEPAQEQNPAGIANGTSAATVALSVSKRPAGVASGTSSAAVYLRPTRPLAGIANGTSSATASLSTGKRPAAVGNGTSTATARLAATRFLAAVANGSSSASANVSNEAMQNPAGVAAGTSSASAGLSVAKRPVALAGSTSVAAVNLSVSKPLKGVAAGTSTATATLAQGNLKALAAVAAGTSTAAVKLQVSVRPQAVAAATSTATANLAVRAKIVGKTSGTSAATAVLSVTKPLAGRANGTSTASVAVKRTRGLAGVANGTSTAAAQKLVARRLLFAIAAAAASASCALEVGVTRYQLGDTLSQAPPMQTGRQLMTAGAPMRRVR